MGSFGDLKKQTSQGKKGERVLYHTIFARSQSIMERSFPSGCAPYSRKPFSQKRSEATERTLPDEDVSE
jgi:hypothetical protein